MNKKNSSLFVALAGAGLMTMGSVQAVQPYWHDASGTVVRDGFGGCVQTNDWRPELATVECGAKPAAKPVLAVPAPAPAPAPVAPVVQSKPMTLSADTAFAFGSEQLSPAARAELDRLIAQIRQMDRVESISIAGHTDNVGSAAFNQGLSQRRADAVKGYMVERGVDATKITTSGHGFSQPVADNATAEGRAANRRVDIDVKGVGK